MSTSPVALHKETLCMQTLSSTFSQCLDNKLVAGCFQSGELSCHL